MARKSKSAPAKKPAPKKAAAKARVTVLGFAPTAILKWMGKQGWTAEQARNALSKHAIGGSVSPATVSTGLSDGRNPKYAGNAAAPTAAQVKQLNAAKK